MQFAIVLRIYEPSKMPHLTQFLRTFGWEWYWNKIPWVSWFSWSSTAHISEGLEWKIETRVKVLTPTDGTLHAVSKDGSIVPNPCSLTSYIHQHIASITSREIHLHLWSLLYSYLHIWKKIYHIPTLMNCMNCREVSGNIELCRSSDSASQCAWWPSPLRGQWCHLLILLRNEISCLWAM